MKNRLTILFAFVIVLSVLVTGCGGLEEKIDDAINSPTENTENTQNVETTKQVNNKHTTNGELVNAAKEEGISVKEMEQIIDDLAQMGADKYGISKKEYISNIEASDNTVLGEWQVAADYMEMSIKELYEYEKANANNMTQEQKEMMAGMNNALKMAETELQNMPEAGTTDVENMLGIHGNESGEIREVTIDTKEDFSYKVAEVLQDYEDEYSIVFEYMSDGDLDDITKYYDELILNTEGYMKLAPEGAPVIMLQGMVNKTVVYFEIDGEEENGVRVNTYLDLSTKKED